MINKSSKSSSSNDKGTVDSPISAGVDGTQSATGIHHPKEQSDTSYFEWMLTPRCPGKTSPSSTSSSPSWYGVTLDGRTLSTPMGQKLAVPSKSLAYMIAAEWDAQTKQLQPTNMPFMTLACTTLDQAALHPHVYREEALKYLPTDTVSDQWQCYHKCYLFVIFISVHCLTL